MIKGLSLYYVNEEIILRTSVNLITSLPSTWWNNSSSLKKKDVLTVTTYEYIGIDFPHFISVISNAQDQVWQAKFPNTSKFVNFYIMLRKVSSALSSVFELMSSKTYGPFLFFVI